MPDGLRDLVTVLRCTRLAVGLPGAASFALHGAERAVAAFDRVVDPIINDAVSDAADRVRIRRAMICASVKVCFLISSYATMVGLPMDHESVVFGGSFARIYDDLLDDAADADLERRLRGLFRGDTFVAENDLERLLHRLYLAIDGKLRRDRSDPIYTALSALHEYQAMSRRQRDPTISEDSLTTITEGKGAWGIVVLFALVRPTMSEPERQLVKALGEALQLLDDYLDCELDRRTGVTTRMTRRSAHLAEVGRRLLTLRPDIVSHYAGGQVRQFLAVLYVLLVTAFLKRRGVLFVRPNWTPWPGDRSPVLVLLCHGGGVVPRCDRSDQVHFDPSKLD